MLMTNSVLLLPSDCDLTTGGMGLPSRRLASGHRIDRLPLRWRRDAVLDQPYASTADLEGSAPQLWLAEDYFWCLCCGQCDHDLDLDLHRGWCHNQFLQPQTFWDQLGTGDREIWFDNAGHCSNAASPHRRYIELGQTTPAHPDDEDHRQIW